MARNSVSPEDFGIDMHPDDFMDLMVSDFAESFRDATTLDELLLHPDQAHEFCDNVRLKHGFQDVPDDMILRSIMLRRKNPR